MNAPRLTRRRLLGQTALGASALTLGGAIEALTAAAQSLPVPAISPDDPRVRRTIAAFADTIVPGPAGGGDRHPGAIEANVLGELYDPFYGAAPTFPLLHNDLLLVTPVVLGRPAAFELDLSYEDRERVLVDRMKSLGDDGSSPLYVIYIGIGTLVYLTYYGTAQSRVGPRYIRFPPQSDGYYPEHSYGVRFRGMTRDGNPP